MDNTKNDFYCVEKMTEDSDFVVEHLRSFSCQDLSSGPISMDSVCFRFFQISGSGKRISGFFRRSYTEVSWSLFNGLRNWLVHVRWRRESPDVLFTAAHDLLGLAAVLKHVSK